MSTQMMGFQPKSIYCCYHRSEEACEAMRQALQFNIERFLQNVLIDVSQQVNQTPLLCTFDGVIPRVEVGHQNALEVGQHLPCSVGVSRVAVHIRHVLQVRENPNVVVLTL